MSIESITKAGKEYLDAKNNTEVLREKINMIDRGIDFYAKLEIEFKGMYRRSSIDIYLTTEEVKEIINDRLSKSQTLQDKLKKEFEKK